MPGYQSVKIIQPSDFISNNEPIYGQIKSKKKGKGKQHPLFADQKLQSRDMIEKMEYERYLRNKDVIRRDLNFNKLDSMKYMGSCNDIHIMHNNYMSIPRQRNLSVTDEAEMRNRMRPISKSSTMIFGKGDKKNSIHSDQSTVTAAMITSLRNSASEDNLYESVEMIHYMKTMKSLNRQKKTRSLQKTGHSLFDSLREEQAMKEPFRKTSSRKFLDEQSSIHSIRSSEYPTSDGNSPSLSPSSSGDEYETYPRVLSRNMKLLREKGFQPTPEMMSMDKSYHHKGHEKQMALFKKKTSDSNGSESDDEFKIIPRPKFFGRPQSIHKQFPQTLDQSLLKQPQRRRSDISSPSDESDASSFNSTGLR